MAAQELFQGIGARLRASFQTLLGDWRRLGSSEFLKEDLVAGVSVACVALPVILAVAQASHVSPSVGLLSAIVMGVVCSLFGGAPLVVSAPAAAMAIVVSLIVQRFGMDGLLWVGVGCAVLQVLTGVLGLGQLIRFIPLPVVAGFSAGIGAIILMREIPRSLGLPPAMEGHFWGVLTHVGTLVESINPVELLFAVSTIVLTLSIRRVMPKSPAVLLAVLIPTVIALVLKIDLNTIGEIPHRLPAINTPSLHIGNLFGLLQMTGTLFLFASLETLLAASAVDQLSGVKRHDPNQELLGQGLGNLVTSLVGGIPGTAVIARSSLNVQMGAKTRRAALIQAIVLLMAVYFCSPIFEHIPQSVLSAVLMTVAARMLHPHDFFSIRRSSVAESIVFVLTFLTMVVFDFYSGVEIGILAALVLMAFRFCQIRVHVYSFGQDGPCIVSLSGALTFLAYGQMTSVEEQLELVDLNQGVVIDLSRVSAVDVSGAKRLLELLRYMQKKNVHFALRDVSEPIQKFLISLEGSGVLEEHFASNEADTHRVLKASLSHKSFNRLQYGVERFQKEVSAQYQSIFQSLSDSQTPHTLFITCSDSRINPNLITTTDPGELFIIRNVGNMIPAFGVDQTPAEGAAIEYALIALKVKNIILCGHSGCGAMKAIYNAQVQKETLKTLEAEMPSVALWLNQTADVMQEVTQDTSIRKVTEMNLRLQMRNILSYPAVKQRIQSGELELHTWLYDIGRSELEAWDRTKNHFAPLRYN